LFAYELRIIWKDSQNFLLEHGEFDGTQEMPRPNEKKLKKKFGDGTFESAQNFRKAELLT
jgi:hypothetical protein